jgi:CRISPR/Cas system endoribonuclease Cas6 (RAMP superfamily)
LYQKQLLNNPSVMEEIAMEDMSFLESNKFADLKNTNTVRSPILVRKLCSSVVNNSKIYEILQTKKNNRNLNYNIIKENKNIMSKTIDDTNFRVGPIRVDES